MSQVMFKTLCGGPNQTEVILNQLDEGAWILRPYIVANERVIIQKSRQRAFWGEFCLKKGPKVREIVQGFAIQAFRLVE